MAGSIFPAAASAIPSSQPPAGTSSVLFDGSLATVASSAKTITIPKGVHKCLASAPLQFYTPGSGSVVAQISTPTDLSVFAAAASITVSTISTARSWTLKTLPSALDWAFTASNGRTIVAIPTNATNTVAAYSTDGGATWTSCTLPSSQSWGKIAWGNGVFLVVSAISNAAATSPDGITWTARTTNNYGSAQPVGHINFANNQFLLITNNTTNGAQTSPDGITWTVSTNFTSSTYTAVAWQNGTYIAVTDIANTVTAVSQDGLNWSAGVIPTGPYLGILGANGKFFAVGSGAIITSIDGAVWSASYALGWSVAAGTSTTDFGLTFQGGLFVGWVNGTVNYVMFSSDGINYARKVLPATLGFRGLSFAQGTFVALTITVASTAVYQSVVPAVPVVPISFGIYAAPATVL